MRKYSDATLLSMTKRELIEQLRVAENNCERMEATLNRQAENLKGWEPVKHGKWEEFAYDYGGAIDKGYRCSLCSQNAYINSPFCPHCGAKMDLDLETQNKCTEVDENGY